jgi:hypothetical protein
MSNLAPGDYHSWQAIDNNAYFEPDFFKQYEQFGKTNAVTESSNVSVDVKLIPSQ